MHKDNDVEALKHQSSSEFDYQNFSDGKKSTSSKQRWKLLEGVANWSPGMEKLHKKSSSGAPSAERDFNDAMSRPTSQATTSQSTLTGPNAYFSGGAREHRLDERVGTASAPSNEGDVPAAKPVNRPYTLDETASRESTPFSHLFKGYTENDLDDENPPTTSLKALLRQIDS
ncbi:hypothetical protein ACT3UM_08570 [Halomonas sp. AOP13-D3-9]